MDSFLLSSRHVGRTAEPPLGTPFSGLARTCDRCSLHAAWSNAGARPPVVTVAAFQGNRLHARWLQSNRRLRLLGARILPAASRPRRTRSATNSERLFSVELCGRCPTKGPLDFQRAGRILPTKIFRRSTMPDEKCRPRRSLRSEERPAWHGWCP